jgi:DNA-binding winged helix-turn-helix (wHTH) protein/TolB-like protein/Tfp pilus assembly protein PilF
MKKLAAAAGSRLGYEFGGFVLDPLRRQLRRRGDGTLVDLTPRVFDALLYLAERPGQLLDRETLFQALWPGMVVEDNNLSQTLSALRKALGDDQHDRYVLTVPRRGFRFVCPVQEIALDAEGRPALDATPPTDIDTAAPAPSPSPSPSLPPTNKRVGFAALGLGALAVAALLAAAVGWMQLRGNADDRQPKAPLTTLAVLPFKPLLAEHRDEILELGMADSLIVRISTTPGLAVRSIGSVRRYAGPNQDPLAAAAQLDTQWILDGTIQRWGDRVRVTARLLHAPDGTATWSGSFDERFGDVFGAQEQIAERVAHRLIPQLSGVALGRSASGTQDTEAYQLFLTGRFHAQTIRPSGLSRSVELYQRAIDRDPRYALAHAAMADSLRRLTVAADAPPAPTLTRARAAAQRALEIDPDSADAHAALGWVLWWHDWDWAGAEASFRRAIALNPNVAEAHLGLGHLLLSQRRRGDEGLQAIVRARELDPLSRIANALEAAYLVGRGQRDQGLSRLNKAVEIEPDFWPAQLLLASVHQSDGETGKAIAAARRAEQLSEGSAQATARLGTVLALGGRRDDAVAVLHRLTARAQERYVPPTMIAEVQCAIGQRAETLDSLDKALAVRDIHLPFVKITPCLSALQGEARFDALIRKLRLPDGPPATGKL